MAKPKVKTVVLFVRHWDEGADKDYIFTECTEVGGDNHYKHPSEFINEFAKLYRQDYGDGVGFRIVDVVIG